MRSNHERITENLTRNHHLAATLAVNLPPRYNGSGSQIPYRKAATMNTITIRITLLYDEGVYTETVVVPNSHDGHDLLWAHIAMLLSGYPAGTVAQTEPVNA